MRTPRPKVPSFIARSLSFIADPTLPSHGTQSAFLGALDGDGKDRTDLVAIRHATRFARSVRLQSLRFARGRHILIVSPFGDRERGSRSHADPHFSRQAHRPDHFVGRQIWSSTASWRLRTYADARRSTRTVRLGGVDRAIPSRCRLLGVCRQSLNRKPLVQLTLMRRSDPRLA